MQRREWIKKIGAGSIAAVSPTVLLGDTESGLSHSIVEHTGTNDISTDVRVELLVQEDAANGAVVPVGVISSVPDTKKIVLFVSNHARSKVASLDTSNAMIAPRLSTHLQLTNPATITALVQSDAGWFANSAEVKTLGESC